MHNGHGTMLLLADAERERRVTLSQNFQADGYRVVDAPTLQGALQLTQREHAALMVLDATVLAADGLAALERVRRAGSGPGVNPDVPIIVTAPDGDDLACIRTLDAGADDFLRRPFPYMELRARTAALLRRQTRGSQGARLRVGSLEIDAVGRQAWVEGRTLLLAGKEFSLLRLLATEPCKVFTRAELMRSVWGWELGDLPSCSTRTLDSHASRLRRKLRSHQLEMIINVWGRGYRLCDPVASVPETAGPSVQAAPGQLIAFTRAA